MRKLCFNKKILLVEDDLLLSSSLKNFLLGRGYLVAQAYSLSRAYELIRDSFYDLVIIDRQLGEEDGLELVTYLNNFYPESMVFVLTHKSELPERVRGLSLGADEYLPKPFSVKEFLLKVEGLLNKTKNLADNVRFGQLVFQSKTGVLLTPTGKIFLPPGENQLLSLLIRHQNTVITRDVIIQTLWHGKEIQPTEATIDVYVRRLRFRLGKYGRYIRTKRGYGYCLMIEE